MPLPNDLTFKLSDINTELSLSNVELSICFGVAVYSRFDSRYVKSGNWMSEFRNYGYSKIIGTKSDTQLIASGVVYNNCFVLADPTGNTTSIHTLYGDSGDWYLENFILTSGGALSASGYSYSLSNSNITDWAIVDDRHIYIADKYENGGYYYFRIRWFDYHINNPGYDLIDTEVTIVSSTVYAARNPVVTATEDYVYMGNFYDSTSTNYVYRMSIGTSSFGTKTETITFTGVTNFSDLYAENSVFYLAHDLTVNGKLFSYTIESTGALTAVDNITTFRAANQIVGNGYKSLFLLSVDDEYNMHVSHDGSGDSLVQESYYGLLDAAGVDFHPYTGTPLFCSTTYLITTYLDSNSDLQVEDTQVPQYDVEGSSTEEHFTIFKRGCAGSRIGEYVVVAAWFDSALIPSNDQQRLFAYPIS